ncbi:hypothetical protein [Baekduia sp. Peel2402]|uniref:hypothetical protein n=1 Tax=Baekduia sp. Peel2402 TaxID=3458296 RepID=UPI00403EBC32
MAVLHVTNGSHAAHDLQTLGGETLTWDDVLHEGPVPAQPPEPLRETRAQFLADAGLSDLATARARLAARDARLDAVDFSTKLILWFEDDLYDQLQLLQILDRLATGDTPTRRSRPLGPVQLVKLPRGPRTFLRDRLARAASLRDSDHAFAATAWAAFTAPDPRAVEQIAMSAGTPNLPDVAPALQRLLEEHPFTTDGLSRTERQLLEAVQARPLHGPALFAATQAREERPFHGDATLLYRARRLQPQLLDRTEDGAFALTEDGQRVLNEQADALDLLPPLDRWVGGVHHLVTPTVRYDPATRRLAA